MFTSVLIANRGEIARRIGRTVRSMGLKSVAVYSETDAELPFVTESDEAVLIGPGNPGESYLDADKILWAARQTGAEAIHPGYGFLAENSEFARRVIGAGLAWIGPDPDSIDHVSDKINARNLMEDAGVPVAPGTRGPVTDIEAAVRGASRIGYPIMVKATAGGGGIGMGMATDENELRYAFTTASTRGERFFGDSSILLERFVQRARHVEVQIFGHSDGRVVALGERDCSIQRRHQKVIEETPSPGVDDGLRQAMLKAAVRAGEAVNYRGAGTVECLVDPTTHEFMFLEMNTRLQVEHAVTELVTGLDLVELQLLAAAGEDLDVDLSGVEPRGHAIEMRVYAEDSQRFLPSPGTITHWVEASGEGVRVDAGYREGNTVSSFYDPLLAKLCVWAPDRTSALDRARVAVASFEVEGPKTNLEFLTKVLGSEDFTSGNYDTATVTRIQQVERVGQ